MATDVRCWCGEAVEERLSDHYSLCLRCGTAVLSQRPEARHFAVADDARDFYGQRYWHEHQAERNLPTIEERARTDLSERCLFWLANILELMAPPARILEIGCGHGGFVRILTEAGFAAEGTELSPWVIDFARRTFGVRVHLGTLESLALTPDLAGLCSFDVLEHVADPLEFLRRAGELLAADGVLFLQTPWYRGEGPGWSMFQPDEHVFLFSEKAMRLLLDRAGFRDVVIRPSLFPYDMWVAAARQALPPSREISADGSLPAAFRALLDLRCELGRTRAVLARSEADRAARLTHVEELTRLLQESEADRAARLEQVHEFTRLLQESEADRAARLEQVLELTRLLQESEADRAARLGQIHELTRLLQESEAARLDQVYEVQAIKATWIWRARELLLGPVSPGRRSARR